MATTARVSKNTALRFFGIIAVACTLIALSLIASGAVPVDLLRIALWEVVHNVCVPGQIQQNNPRPCLQVDLDGGVDKGFAILKDPRGTSKFLLVPIARIPGIESPALLEPNATNYFAKAWDSRVFIDAALNRTMPRDGIGLAINSVLGRSQDQLHIHIACVQPEVLEALRSNQRIIGNEWTLLNVPLIGQYYMARWLPGDDLRQTNPFRVLAGSLPEAASDMGSYTLVLVGFTRMDGTRGFVMLTDHVDKDRRDSANGEELLDRICSIASDRK